MKMLSKQIKRELQSQPPNHTQHKHYSTQTHTHRGMHVHKQHSLQKWFVQGRCFCGWLLTLWGNTHIMTLSSRTKTRVLKARNVQIDSVFFFFYTVNTAICTRCGGVELSESTSATVPLHKPSGLIFQSGVMIGWLRGRHLWIIQ